MGPQPARPTGLRNELSGTVIGPSVQAGAIHGGVHFHAGHSGPAPVPRQLPAPVRHFTGREAELVWLDAILDEDRAGLIVLSGPGGVGKTALAVCWAHSVRQQFADGQMYTDLGGFGGDEPVDPSTTLSAFLRALGVAPQRIPVPLAEQVALYRSVTAERALLVVADNVYSAAQVRVLVPASAASLVLVTSRSRLVGLVPDGARLVQVTPLPRQDAVELLTRTVGADRIGREPRPAEQLADLCGGLPIALCLAAARLAARPQLSVGRVARDLASEADRLAMLSTMDGSSVEAAFDLSYRVLPPGAAALYRRLALHPGPEFGTGPVAAVAATIDRDGPATGRTALDMLLEASLVQEVDEDRFRFHDLLRLHGRQMAEVDETRPDRDAAVLAVLGWYFGAARQADLVVTPYRRRLPYAFAAPLRELPALSTRDEALGWLERDRLNLIAAGRAAIQRGYAALAWHLSDVLWPLLLYRKHYGDWMELDRRGVAAARAWGNAWAEAVMLKRLGRTCTKAGDFEAAERYTRAAIARYREAGDARGSLDAREGLAAIHRDAGRVEQAAELFARVLTANREAGEERSTGLTLINLGMLLPKLNRPAEAVELLLEAERLFGRLSATDPYNLVRVSIGLASAYLGTGDLDPAHRAATEAVRQMYDLGSDYEAAEAMDLLGQIAERRGDAVTARRHYGQALEIFLALGSARAASLGRRLAAVGEGGLAVSGAAMQTHQE